MTPTDKLREKAEAWIADNVSSEPTPALDLDLYLVLADVRREALEEAAEIAETARTHGDGRHCRFRVGGEIMCEIRDLKEQSE